MYTFIVNPNSRSGTGLRLWNSVESVLKARNVRYQVFFTKYQHHATGIARKLTSDLERHTIIALGGDGTINEVINGITSLSKVTLGYIPTGSGNDFARSLRLPTDPLKALDNILTPVNYTSINIGVLSYEDVKRRFAVSSGIGFDAGVCHEVMVSRLKILLNKIRLGKLTYVGIALKRIITLTPRSMTLLLDDERKIVFDRVYFATAMNLAYEGGGFKFCPKADSGDDLLDMIVISNMPKLKALSLLPTAFKGWHTRFKGVNTYTCKKIDIISEVPLPLHADGEPILSQTHMNVCLEPEKLRIIGTPL
ncbi:diacylglycerol/lipid kinase family protein [Bariatricus sp. SGI.154]|uniref:diacylglycerol/lipid kinase family protein n=1 Tax=Bariatricus sp. SGI.154 TaxID=3420549 RepID=UPI003CFE4886